MMEHLRHLLSHVTYPIRKFDIETLPRRHMLPDLEAKYMANLYDKANRVLELGSGGSTLYCDDRNIVCDSYETDHSFYLKLRDKLSKHTTVTLNYIDIGKTASYSEPFLWKFRDISRIGELYISCVDRALNEHEHDLIFIDGRWRIACALVALGKKTNASTNVIIDDVFPGRYYLKHINRLFNYTQKGRLAILHSVKNNVDLPNEIDRFVQIAD